MTRPAVAMRPATAADLPWIIAFEWRPELLAFIGGSDIEQHRAWLADPDFRQVLALDAAGERVGYALLNGYLSTPGVRLLRRIAVLAPGRGVGSAFLRWLIDQAFAEGVERFRLAVFEDNARARRVYARFGFVPEPGAEIKPFTRRDGITTRNLPLVLYRSGSPDGAFA
jgi:RimJ/RimL family protein N-acetyltransferase